MMKKSPTLAGLSYPPLLKERGLGVRFLFPHHFIQRIFLYIQLVFNDQVVVALVIAHLAHYHQQFQGEYKGKEDKIEGSRHQVALDNDDHGFQFLQESGIFIRN